VYLNFLKNRSTWYYLAFPILVIFAVFLSLKIIVGSKAPSLAGVHYKLIVPDENLTLFFFNFIDEKKVMVGNSNAEEVLFHYTNTDKNISIVDFAGDTLVCLLCEKIADNANCTIRIEGLDDFTGTLIKD